MEQVVSFVVEMNELLERATFIPAGKLNSKETWFSNLAHMIPTAESEKIFNCRFHSLAKSHQLFHCLLS